MNIDIVTPHNESSHYKNLGPVAQVIFNSNRHCPKDISETIFGKSEEKFVKFQNYKQLKPSFFSILGQGKEYCRGIKLFHKQYRLPDILEIHNRPVYFNEFGSKYRKVKKILYLHNDPRDMKGFRKLKYQNNIDGVITISNFIKRCFIELVGNEFNHTKIVTIHNGIDRWLTKFPTKQKIIVFSGRLNSDKGIIELLDALKTILPNFPSWKAYIFGRPDRNLDFNYLNSFESHRQIKLMGEKPNSIVKSYLEKAEISCVPSKWNEPLSLSVLESLAAGCALLTSRKGGIPEVAEGKAFFLDEVNSEKIISSLTELIQNKYLRKDLQDKAWRKYHNSAKLTSEKLNKFRNKIYNDKI